MVMIVTRAIVCDKLIIFFSIFEYLNYSFQMVMIVTHGLRLCVSFSELFVEN